jgi:peptidoglycan hydrolase CwlO-like protein
MRSAFAKHFGAEDLVPEEGDPDYESWEKNNQDRLERLDKTNKFNQEFNENLEFSEKSIDEFAKENNLKPEEAEKILGEFDDMLKDIFRGKITKETLTKIMRAVKHDEAVKEAKKDGLEEGEIKARNEKIKATKEEAADKKGDGMPILKSTGDAIEDAENKPEGEQIIDRIFQKSKQRSNF